MKAGADDWNLVQSLLSLMANDEADFTLTFRHLRDAFEKDGEKKLIELFEAPAPINEWLSAWRSRLSNEDDGVDRATALMRQVNPVFIPRNHRVEEVIQAGIKHDFEPFHRLHAVLQRPFDEQSDFAEYEMPPKPEEEVQATFCGT